MEVVWKRLGIGVTRMKRGSGVVYHGVSNEMGVHTGASYSLTAHMNHFRREA